MANRLNKHRQHYNGIRLLRTRNSKKRILGYKWL